ncbi:MAG: inorganic phosphate transporter [Alistipes sp.]|nr:inorganic phosphate transporter [Alistipes sp.]
MIELYIAVVAVLAILAVSGLYVGVTNDAVNFLNSAIGSKAAKMRTILIVASVGIIIGAMTSSGMMEVARNGMFNPGLFTFKEVMLLYVGVMIANVVLLDLYNSLGLPTSTTVSLIFCLLGSAVAVSLYKIATDDAVTFSMLGEYINTSRAMGIVSAILLSVVLAFVCGTILMYISRVIFSFRYVKMMRYLGAAWCGLSLTSIVYFALFKGLKNILKGSAFIGWINDNLLLALFICWAVCTLILFFLQIFRVNILRITILAGTFSLALAFAGNDLVNFIGVPIAGFDAFSYAKGADGMNEGMLMEALNKPETANILYILAAGLIMVITLWTSSKAMHVSETELSLSAQGDDVQPQHSSSLFSRTLVRGTLGMVRFFDRVTPQRVKTFVESRFEWADIECSGAPYDMIRATVNLTTSSLLIALATSLKLPLSTTYVCFMVAMGSSLADRAWGRESAVYRITGVMTVIMGWFVTAIGGFLIALVVGLLLMWGGWIAFGLLTALCLYMLVHSNVAAARKQKQKDEGKKDETASMELSAGENVADNVVTLVSSTIKSSTHIYNRTVIALMKENRKALKELLAEANEAYERINILKYSVASTLRRAYETDLNLALYYVQMIDYLNEMTKSMTHIVRPAFEHIDNNHEGLTRSQSEDLIAINSEVDIIYSRIIYMVTSNDYSDIDNVLDMRDELFRRIADLTKSELARISNGESNSKSGMLYMGILGETKTLVLQSRNLLKSQRRFMEQTGRNMRRPVSRM